MKIVKHYRYPVSASELHQLFIDREFYEARSRNASSPIEITCHEERNGEMVIGLKREMAVRQGSQVPGFVKKIMKSSNPVITYFYWSLSGQEPIKGRYEIEAPGAPVKSWGLMRIDPVNEQECEHYIELNVESSVPLVGKKIAGFIGEKAGKGLDRDHSKTLEILTTRTVAEK